MPRKMEVPRINTATIVYNGDKHVHGVDDCRVFGFG